MRQLFTLSCFWLLALVCQPVQAYDREDVVHLYHVVKHYIDSADFKGVEPGYIDLPDAGFVGSLTGSLAGTHVTLDYSSPKEELNGVDLLGRLNSLVSNKLAVGVSYRGWGLSYSTSLSGAKDTEWTFNSYGQARGLELSIHNSTTLSGDFERNPRIFGLNGRPLNQDNSPMLSVHEGDIHQRTFLMNFYWVLNHSRFSLPAAMSHTVIQRRSAGSFLVIMNLYHVSSKITEPALALSVGPAFEPEGEVVRSQFGKLSQSQLSLGGGYAYNYVFPNRNLLLHGSFMPMLGIWHRNRTYWDVLVHNSDGNIASVFSHDAAFSQKPIALNALAHLNLVYNQGRSLYGLLATANAESLPGRGRLSIYSVEWSVRCIFGVRF